MSKPEKIRILTFDPPPIALTERSIILNFLTFLNMSYTSKQEMDQMFLVYFPVLMMIDIIYKFLNLPH